MGIHTVLDLRAAHASCPPASDGAREGRRSVERISETPHVRLEDDRQPGARLWGVMPLMNDGFRLAQSSYTNAADGLNCLIMLHGWDNFFIMAGTAAATLIGLVFVAVTVGAGFSKSSITHGARGFLTPTLIRFGGVLFLSLAVLAPWPSAKPIGIILSLGGLAGLAYQIKVIVGRRKVGLILLDWHDWLPHMGVPALGSGSLVAGAAGLLEDKSFAPYAIACAAVLLLFAGVYGAWDLTLWMIKNREKI
jgi:hypothetical protein